MNLIFCFPVSLGKKYCFAIAFAGCRDKNFNFSASVIIKKFFAKKEIYKKAG